MKLEKALKSKLIIFCLFLLACSCSSEPFLYDKPGFDAGTRPNEKNPDSPVTIAPDYYYRQPSYNQQNYTSQQPVQYQQQMPYQQPQYYYPQQPVYYHPYPPVMAPGYNNYGNTGGSRFYSNPYAIPASAQYPNYDADQYYVPPTYYQNVEPQNQQRSLNNSVSQNRS